MQRILLYKLSVSFWCTTNKGLKMFVTQSSLINILEWGFFILLSLLSFGFMIWGEVVQKFLMNSTSFMQYSQAFYESPTITICFSHMTINGSTLVYGEDFWIRYRYISYLIILLGSYICLYVLETTTEVKNIA